MTLYQQMRFRLFGPLLDWILSVCGLNTYLERTAPLILAQTRLPVYLICLPATRSADPNINISKSVNPSGRVNAAMMKWTYSAFSRWKTRVLLSLCRCVVVSNKTGPFKGSFTWKGTKSQSLFVKPPVQSPEECPNECRASKLSASSQALRVCAFSAQPHAETWQSCSAVIWDFTPETPSVRRPTFGLLWLIRRRDGNMGTECCREHKGSLISFSQGQTCCSHFLHISN